MSKVSKLISYEDFISRDNKFYYVNDIKFTLKHFNLNPKGKKTELLDRLNKFYLNIKNYQKFESSIITIQKFYRGYKTRHIDKFRGPGFFIPEYCKNDEEFYNMESLHKIPKYYLFTYKDISNNIWGFDIRSFKQLVDKKSDNPYTREKIPFKIIQNMNKVINYLKKHNYPIEYNEIKLTPEQEFNNRVLSTFQTIDTLNVAAGGTDPNWFKDLNIYQLKTFYKHLEDIWNYRAELTLEKQLKIVPGGNVLKFPIQYLNSIKQIRKLQTLILDEIDKLISSSDYESDCSTGAYYVLIALCEVSATCANAMPWLVMVNAVN
jgi:hypothetical protein